MENKKWKSGDLVRLKSGGPTMTVDRYVRPYDAGEQGPSAAVVTKCVFFQTQNYAAIGTSGVQCLMFCEVDEGALEEVKS